MKMNENNIPKKKLMRGFLFDLLRGVGIGVAFIIPGFSGGSVAAILGIYERLIGAVAGIFKEFKKSLFTLLPVGIGMGIGAVSLLFPLEWALGKIPLPTVSLFVGLTLGCLPVLYKEVKGKITYKNVLAFVLPLLLAVSMCFLPIGEDVNLYTLTFFGHILLILIGIIGSSALIIPGISGSMLLLMLGYYNPTVSMITSFLGTLLDAVSGEEFLWPDLYKPLIVLSLMAVGIAIGFIGFSVIMKRLFATCRRGTYLAILGFIVGSLPTVYASTVKEAGYTLGNLPTSPWHWIGCVAALLLGCAISVYLVIYSNKKSKAKSE